MNAGWNSEPSCQMCAGWKVSIVFLITRFCVGGSVSGQCETNTVARRSVVRVGPYVFKDDNVNSGADLTSLRCFCLWSYTFIEWVLCAGLFVL